MLFLAILLQWIVGIGNDMQMVATYGVAILTVPIAGAVLLVWGLPVHFALSAAGQQSVWWYASAGFVPAPLAVFAFKPFGADPLPTLISQSLYFGMFGVTGALVFWWLVVKLRPGSSSQPSS